MKKLAIMCIQLLLHISLFNNKNKATQKTHTTLNLSDNITSPEARYSIGGVVRKRK